MVSTMVSPKTSAFASGIDDLPPLPTVVARVMEIAADPESSVQDLMKVVSADQSLAIMILKMANSAFFGLARGVDSLTQALTILGFKEIRNLVLGRAVFASFKNVGKDDKFEIHQFWRHSFVCGIGAKIIGAELKWAGHDFFVAGLIHDIGKLVMHVTFPVDFARTIEIAGSAKRMAFEAEEIIFGITHGEIGMMLLKRWMFPQGLMSAVGYHHRIREAVIEPRFSLVIHAADILAHLDEQRENAGVECSADKECFGVDVVNLFREHGVLLGEDALENFLKALAEQKERDLDLLKLFLS